MQLRDENLFRQRCYVDGEWIDADDGATFDITDPANGRIIGTAPALGRRETKRAIEAADNSWPDWRAKTAKQRSSILRAWHDLILENTEDLAIIMTTEQGKPLAESRNEIAYAAEFVEWFAEEAKRIYGDIVPEDQVGRRIVVLKQPVGVAAAITPWNFPSAMITRKVAPALAAGCTVVARPASQTPFSAFALADLAARAGVPKGVFSVVSGPAATTGAELLENPIVRKVSFTGSTEVGKILMAKCAGTVKKLSLELGGNAPFLVFDDADLDSAIEGALISKFRNAGQTCVCANRLLIQDSIYDEFVQKLAQRVSTMKVGPGLSDNVDIGPLIDVAGVNKVEEHVADAIAKGARIVAGGQRHALGGTYFEPTVVADATNEMLVAKEETFGPLAPLFPFHDENQAIKMANDTPYGLGAYFYTRDLGRAWRLAEGLEYGLIGANQGFISSVVAPFGGVKESGIGREGSKYGIEEFIEIKYFCIGGIGA